jgi:hypothetical protein
MNRNRSSVILALGALVALLATSTVAMAQQDEATASAVPALAKIVAAIAISNTADLNFGSVVASVAGGTVVLAPSAGANGRTATGVTLSNTTGVSAARFTVTGEAGAGYGVTLPGDSDVTLTGAGDPMTITAFTSSPSGTNGLLTAGTQTLYVGGTLNVGASQAAGSYAGTFDVTVTYN